MAIDYWLKCDACNAELKQSADRAMQLAFRFKPSLVHVGVRRMGDDYLLRRCVTCGWCNVFVAAPALTPRRWADIVLK